MTSAARLPRRLQPAAVFAGYAVFFVLFFAPVLASGNYLTSGDGNVLALPAYLGAHGLWEPNIMLGYPWSSAMNAAWYPLWALHLIPGSFNAYMVLAYVLAAFGAFGLVSAATGHRLAGIVAGFTYSLGGFMIGHLGHYDVVHTGAWMPYVMWALVELRARSTMRWAITGAFALALCVLSGQPQVFAYTFLVALAFGVVFAWPPHGRARWIVDAAIVLGGGAALAAIVLIPGYQLARQSVRAVLPFADFSAFSLPPLQIPFRLLFPYYLGTTSSGLYKFGVVAGGSFTELANFAGIMTLVLAIVALAAWRARREVWFWFAVAVCGLFASTGDYLGVAHVTYHLPVLSAFRAQGRHAVEVTLALSVLGGYGVAAILERAASRRTVFVAIAAVAIAMAATLAAAPAAAAAFLDAATAASIPHDALHNSTLGIPLLMFVAVAAAIAAFAFRPDARVARAVLVLAVVADMSSFAWFAYWRFWPVAPSSLAPPPYVARVRAELDRTHERILSLTPDTVLMPNVPVLWGLPQADGYVSLLLTRVGNVLLMIPSGTVTPPIYTNPADPGINLAAVRYVAFGADFPAASQFAADPARWRRVPDTGTTLVYENLAPHPRVWTVHDVRGETFTQAVHALHNGSVPYATAATVDGPPPPVVAPGSSAADRVRIDQLADTSMTLTVDCRTACLTVTSDAWYPGWRATVDGAATTIYPTDFGLRGVAVPAGTHVVRFRYEPRSLLLGAAVSLLTLAFLAVLGYRARQRASAASAVGE